jgi:hypothetical protein
LLLTYHSALSDHGDVRLIQLAAELRAVLLADLVGVAPGTAVRWIRAAGGDWGNYAAERARIANR